VVSGWFVGRYWCERCARFATVKNGFGLSLVPGAIALVIIFSTLGLGYLLGPRYSPAVTILIAGAIAVPVTFVAKVIVSKRWFHYYTDGKHRA
jgi:hypothetical protein